MQATPFLMFTGDADEALNLYCSAVPGSKIETIERYQEGEAGKAGTVKRAVFNLAGTRYMCIDSPIKHNFTFTPSFSIFLDTDSREQFDAIVSSLEAGAQTLMPAGNYGFSTWFTWFQDRFGVSWQVNLP